MGAWTIEIIGGRKIKYSHNDMLQIVQLGCSLWNTYFYIFWDINALKCTYVCPRCYCLVRKAVYCDFNRKWWIEPSIKKTLFVSCKMRLSIHCYHLPVWISLYFLHKIPIWIVLYSTLFRDVQMKILTSSASWLIPNLKNVSLYWFLILSQWTMVCNSLSLR